MARYSRARIAGFLDTCDNAPDNNTKGAALEELAKYVLEKVPGLVFHGKNILDGQRVHELDVIFWNRQHRSDLAFLDPVVIVECKNTGNPVGSAAVGWFVRKLQDRGSTYGLLVALNGITGDANQATSAYREVRTALMRDGVKILIVAREELLALETTDDLAELLQTKLLDLVLYRTVA